MMLVNYKGGNAALTVSVAGGSFRLLPNTPVLLTGKQASELQARSFTKKLVKSKQIEFISLDSLDKDELAQLASQNGHELTGKEKVKDLIDLLTDDDEDDTDDGAGDEDDSGTGDGAGTGTDLKPNE